MSAESKKYYMLINAFTRFNYTLIKYLKGLKSGWKEVLQKSLENNWEMEMNGCLGGQSWMKILLVLEFSVQWIIQKRGKWSAKMSPLDFPSVFPRTWICQSRKL